MASSNSWRILGGDEGGGDAVTRQGVTQQVEGATVDVLGGDDVIAGLVMLRTAYSTAAAPEATVRPAVPPSRAAIRSSNTPWVELVRRP